MKLQYVEAAVVLKDRANIVNARYPIWEIPLLEAVHAGGVSVVREVVEDRPAPSSDSEYDRLNTVYGNIVLDDGTQGGPVVAAVYGSMGEGRRRLKTAMQEAVLQKDAEVTPFESPKLSAALAASVLQEISPEDVAKAADSDDLIG
jgi:hypothetical protein